MNLPGQATLRSSVVKVGSPPWSSEPFADAELALGCSRAPPPGAARGLDVLAQGCGLGALVPAAHEHLLGDEGFLGSSFLVARALDVVGLVQGPRTLEPGILLSEEVAEVLPEPRRPCMMVGEAVRETAHGSPPWR